MRPSLRLLDRPENTPQEGPRPHGLAFDGKLENAPFACVHLDPRGGVLAANRTARAALGLGPRRRGLPVMSAFVAPEDMQAFFAFLQQRRTADATGETTLRLRRPSGEQWWCQLTAGEMTDDGLLLGLVDVSPQREATERLSESEARTRSLLESLPDAVFVLQEGIVVDANPAASKLVGTEPIGATLSSFVVPEQQSLLEALLRNPPDKELDRHTLSFQPSPGTSPRLIETSWLPTTYQGARASVCVARDRTQEKQLEARVAHRDRLATAGVLAAGVAHELNNPLTYVLMNLEELASAVGTLSVTAAVEESVQSALDGAKRIAKIVADLRGVVNPNDDTTAVDLNEVVHRSISLMGAHLRARIAIRRDLGQLPHVCGNEGRLVQVVSNLIMNAVQAIGDAKGQLTLSTEHSREGVVLTVRDTGPGIDPKVARQLFEPFVTTKRVGEGTGLGLYVCDQYVRACGGSITCCNLEKGAEFRVSLLPFDLPSPSTIDAEDGEPDYGGGLRVLIVDDEPTLRDLLARQLSALGQVDVAESGEQALEYLAAGRRYGVILSDLIMPGLGGREFYARVVRDHPEQAPSVCFMSGGAVSRPDRAFVEGCVRPLLQKPFSREQLLSYVTNCANAASEP